MLAQDISKHGQQTCTISLKEFAYIISVLHNLMYTHWWCNEAIEMHVCKLSIGSEKLKFG